MKKAKSFRRVLISILLLACLFLPLYQLKADSGFDGSYDSGSSSSSSSSSSNSSSSSSSSGSHGGHYSSGSSDGGGSAVAFFAMIIIIFIVFALAVDASESYGDSNVITNRNTNPLKNVPLYNIEELKKVLPDFSEEEFIDVACSVYENVQEAWMNLDKKTMHSLVTNPLFNTYCVQMNSLMMKNERNIMKDFEYLTYRIDGMEISNNTVSLYVNLKLKCYDYVVDKDNRTVRGNDNCKVWYNYLMVFTRSIGKKENKCPNCGATLESVNVTKCPYCRSSIVLSNYDWVLAKKMVLEQTVNAKDEDE